MDREPRHELFPPLAKVNVSRQIPIPTCNIKISHKREKLVEDTRHTLSKLLAAVYCMQLLDRWQAQQLSSPESQTRAVGFVYCLPLE